MPEEQTREATRRLDWLRRHIPQIAVALALFSVILPTWLALQSPVLGLRLAPDPTTGRAVVAAVTARDGDLSRLAPGDVVTALVSPATGQRVVLDADMLIEDPDMLPSYPAFNRFFQVQERIHRLLQQDSVLLETSRGVLRATPRPRRLGDLPFEYWFQIFCGIFAAVTALTIYLFNPLSTPVRSLLLGGVSFYVVTLSAALYSTRELGMDGSLLRLLSQLNHLGSLIFSATFFTFFWYYPTRIGWARHHPVLTIALLVYLALWLMDLLQITPDLDTGLRWPIMAALLLSLILLAWQWVGVRNDAVKRASLTWIFFSVFLTGALFVGLVIASHALGIDLQVSQAYGFGVLALMYLGLALGVSRYRLFKLETWWNRLWLGVIVLLSILLIDGLLVYLVHLDGSVATLSAIGIIGWLYYPLRHRFMTRFFTDSRQLDERLLSRIVRLGLSWSDRERFADELRAMMRSLFSPLLLEFDDGLRVASPALSDDGTTLLLPGINELPPMKIARPWQGQRLFTEKDKRLAEQLWRLIDQAIHSETAFQKGQQKERERIYGDLHDDLGAKLLSLVYRAHDETSAQLARSALQDLRDIVSSKEHEALQLEQALDKWQAEARQRLHGAGMKLEWHQSLSLHEQACNPTWTVNVGKVIREAISNIIKHTDTSRVAVRVWEHQGALHLAIEDFGSIRPDCDTFRGRGTRSMDTRMAESGGHIRWQDKAGGGCIVELRTPFSRVLSPAAIS